MRAGGVLAVILAPARTTGDGDAAALALTLTGLTMLMALNGVAAGAPPLATSCLAGVRAPSSLQAASSEWGTGKRRMTTFKLTGKRGRHAIAIAQV